MEDFGSIVWGLVIVSFGLYSLVAKARKARGLDTPDQEEQPEHEAPESSLEKTLRELLGEEAVPRREKAPKPAQDDTQPDAEVFTYDKQAEQQQEVFSYDTDAEKPREVFSYDTAAEKPREVFSYDTNAGKPHEVSSYDTASTKPQEVTSYDTAATRQREVVAQEVTTYERLFSRNKDTKAPDKVGSMTTMQRTQHAADSSVEATGEAIAFDYTEDPSEEIGAAERSHKPAKTAENPLHGALNEEFDLRRAVIYSELLKPKFEQ